MSKTTAARRTPRFGVRGANGRVLTTPAVSPPGSSPVTEMLSQSVPLRPSVLASGRGGDWRRKYVQRTLQKMGGKQQPPVPSNAPSRSRSRVAGDSTSGGSAGVGAGAGSAAGSSPATNVTVQIPVPGRTPVAAPRNVYGVGAYGGGDMMHGSMTGASTSAPDADDFMYLDDDVFGWSNDMSGVQGGDGASVDSRNASEYRDEVGELRGVTIGRRYDGSQHGNGLRNGLSASFVPPHQLVSRDCFSLGVRREFRSTKAPM